ncbi:iron ABC transporter permease [Paenibacillus sp. N5-1-1-5]|uniref:Iron ABC transporter permease n=2 Tax=Paenibacillus radicis (ex Xue et al. 2023) TaxID=2972489 RepID=A0ABT1YI57_9BACL|nr:iron ABC transporter permease [Paenibacillus radicis (ex Xue et al. 2023)]MCR8632866.1 iron ABC transporter permease [Paenibacillus radicis (ex Xue et al. 2023)]
MMTENWLKRKYRMSIPSKFALLAICFVAVVLISLNSGLIRLTPIEVIQTLFGYESGPSSIVLFDIRLPRITIAILVGMGFAVTGAIMQGVSQNSLADPGILGINAGAGLAVVVYIAFFYGKIQFAPVYMLPIVAFVGAAAAALLVFALAYKNGKLLPVRLLLVGIAAGAGISAGMLFLTYRMNAYNYDFVKIWLSGSIWGTNWKYVLAVSIWIAVLLPVAVYKSHRINLLFMGEEIAQGVGVSVQRERIVLMAIAVGLAGSCVAVAGSIGFVGLIAPHLAIQLLGRDYKVMLPASAIIGAVLVLLSDTIGRVIAQPVEIPVGIVTAGIGAPYFLYLLTRR